MNLIKRIIAGVIANHVTIEGYVRGSDPAIADDILAALAEAGLKVVRAAPFKMRLKPSEMETLDEMAESMAAMGDGRSLEMLLKQYRAMVEAANEQ